MSSYAVRDDDPGRSTRWSGGDAGDGRCERARPGMQRFATSASSRSNPARRGHRLGRRDDPCGCDARPSRRAGILGPCHLRPRRLDRVDPVGRSTRTITSPSPSIAPIAGRRVRIVHRRGGVFPIQRSLARACSDHICRSRLTADGSQSTNSAQPEPGPAGSERSRSNPFKDPRCRRTVGLSGTFNARRHVRFRDELASTRQTRGDPGTQSHGTGTTQSAGLPMCRRPLSGR
jgi:hypothetical protein